MINKVTLLGNVGRDPEQRHFEGGGSVAKFSVATNENYQDRNGEWQKITEWHEVSAWGKLSDYAMKYIKKGSLVYIEGKITYSKYTDKDNIERKVTDIKPLTIRLLDRKESSDVDTSSNYSSAPSTPSAPSTEAGSIEMQDDDLPF